MDRLLLYTHTFNDVNTTGETLQFNIKQKCATCDLVNVNSVIFPLGNEIQKKNAFFHKQNINYQSF